LFGSALQAYFKALDAATLADITGPAPAARSAGATGLGATGAIPMRAPVSRRQPAAKRAPKV